VDPSRKPKSPSNSPPAGPSASARPSWPIQPPSGSGARPAKPSGQVRHDDRGNAIWDWLKDTGRNAIESTSRLLKKLEAPQLKVEDSGNVELRIQGDRDPGGGYDPYNQTVKPRTRRHGK
jgi:hypothetical protein